MKTYSSRLLTRTLLASMVLLPLAINPASALIKRSVIEIPLSKKMDSKKPASKLEIVAAVKARYAGTIDRIISVRKKNISYGKNCHYVKILDSKGEFIEARVACKK